MCIYDYCYWVDAWKILKQLPKKKVARCGYMCFEAWCSSLFFPGAGKHVCLPKMFERARESFANKRLVSHTGPAGYPPHYDRTIYPPMRTYKDKKNVTEITAAVRLLVSFNAYHYRIYDDSENTDEWEEEIRRRKYDMTCHYLNI